MADDDEGPEVLDGTLREQLFWFGEFCRHGMCSPQAEVLASKAGVDRHAVRELMERGCDPDTAFLIFS